MRIPICDSWGCKIILPSAIEIVVPISVNLMKSSQLIKRVWSFNYLILSWFIDAFYLIYFIIALFHFFLSQLSISIVTNFAFVYLRIKVDCTIVVPVAFLITSIHVEMILNIHHFITCCVHLHIGINIIWLKNNQQGAISWGSKKQTCITYSTMTAEFVTLALYSKEAEWLKAYSQIC